MVIRTAAQVFEELDKERNNNLQLDTCYGSCVYDTNEDKRSSNQQEED